MKKPNSVESFGEYVGRIMKESGLSALKVEKRIKHEAEKRGLTETHKCSDATIYNIVNGVYGGLNTYTVEALSWGLARPLEEVVRKAFGLSISDHDAVDSGLAALWETYKSLESSEDKKYFKRQIEAMHREMLRTQ